MNTLTGGPEKYIFYLQLSDDLPEEFFQLSYFFNKWGISLIPVNVVQFNELAEKKRQHVVVFVPDHRGYEKYKMSFNRYLKLGMLSKKYCIHELSSFSKVNSAHQFERAKSYYHYRMPLCAETFVKSVVREYYLEHQFNKRWPGTRRGRLPSLISGV